MGLSVLAGGWRGQQGGWWGDEIEGEKTQWPILLDTIPNYYMFCSLQYHVTDSLK